MRTHKLKIWTQYFSRVLDGSKPFEWRKNDRDYQTGDILILQEWVPNLRSGKDSGGFFTGNEVTVIVTYIAEGIFEMPDGYCVLGFHKLDFKLKGN